MILKPPRPIEGEIRRINWKEHITNIRLDAYLEKVEAQFKWDRAGDKAPFIFGGQPRPSLEQDEARAAAMGNLEKFELAALEKRMQLEDREIETVARISPNAAEIYGADIEAQRDQALHRASYEADNRIARGMHRWAQQERDRHPERQERAFARFGASSGIVPWDERPPTTPNEAKGGLKEHARRESVLEEARRHVARQRGLDQSKGLG